MVVARGGRALASGTAVWHLHGFPGRRQGPPATGCGKADMRRTLAIVALLAATAGRADSLPFQPGERMDFAVAWLHIPTGRARLSLGRAEGSVWPMILQARTDGVASLVDVRQHLVSYWDSRTRLPLGSDLQAVELGYRHTDRSRFDRERGKVAVTVQGRSRSEKVLDVPPGAQDFMSAFLWLRLQPMEPGARYELPVFAGDKTFTLVAEVRGREELEVPAGRFATVEVGIRTAFEGKFRTHRDSVLWFSDDPRHVLVQASADFAVGSLVARLAAYAPGGGAMASAR